MLKRSDDMTQKISIHAPRVGSDPHAETVEMSANVISIHAPRVGSDPRPRHVSSIALISIHAPRVGSDDTIFSNCHNYGISIHAPRVGSDVIIRRAVIIRAYFNPRSPGGERLLVRPVSGLLTITFQSTLPGWGATLFYRPQSGGASISIHAPRVGSDRENGHLRPRYGQNHPFSTLIVSQIVIDVLGTVRKSQKHQRTSHYEVIKQPERRK